MIPWTLFTVVMAGCIALAVWGVRVSNAAGREAHPPRQRPTQAQIAWDDGQYDVIRELCQVAHDAIGTDDEHLALALLAIQCGKVERLQNDGAWVSGALTHQVKLAREQIHEQREVMQNASGWED